MSLYGRPLTAGPVVAFWHDGPTALAAAAENYPQTRDLVFDLLWRAGHRSHIASMHSAAGRLAAPGQPLQAGVRGGQLGLVRAWNAHPDAGQEGEFVLLGVGAFLGVPVLCPDVASAREFARDVQSRAQRKMPWTAYSGVWVAGDARDRELCPMERAVSQGAARRR